MISSCPTRPPRLLVSSIQPVPQNMSPLTLVVMLITPHITLPVHALLDSGSAGASYLGADILVCEIAIDLGGQKLSLIKYLRYWITALC